MTLKLIAVALPPLVTSAAALFWSTIVGRGLVEGHRGGRGSVSGVRDIRTW
jgi:hypothetical protein